MKLNELLTEERFKQWDVQYKDLNTGKKIKLVLNGTSKNAIEVALRQPNIEIIFIKELKRGQMAEGGMTLSQLVPLISEATLPGAEDIIGFLNKEFLPSFARERHDVFGDHDLLDKGNDMKKDAKIFLKDIRQSQFKSDLKGMGKFVNFNPWPKWTSDVIETSDLFDHVDGLPAKKQEFREWKRDATKFIAEVKKLLAEE